MEIGLWRIMRFLGFEDKSVRTLEALYEHTMSAVRVDGGLSEWFQGCVLSYYLIFYLKW